MEKTANQQNTAAEKPEEKAGMQKDTVENPSEVRTDSAFDEESEGSRATDKQENPDKTSAGAGAGGAAAADENDKDNDNGAAADADASPQCQTDLNELICEEKISRNQGSGVACVQQGRLRVPQRIHLETVLSVGYLVYKKCKEHEKGIFRSQRVYHCAAHHRDPAQLSTG